jgi:alpha-L-rhamnosidase
MTIRRFLTFIQAALFLSAPAQENPSRVNAGWDTLRHAWRADWICDPEASPVDYGVFHFRRTFTLDTLPREFVIHVSADNRYRLFVNGRYAASGPARGDLLHWPYETMDIRHLLKRGENSLAAMVFNFGGMRPAAQHTNRTAFILQAEDESFSALDSGPLWKVFRNPAYSPLAVSERQAGGYYAASPGDSVVGSCYPWGWEIAEYDDAGWSAARRAGRGVGNGYMHGEGWYLSPRAIPMMEEREEPVGRIVRISGRADTARTGAEMAVIPANASASLVLDHGTLTMGVPSFRFRGGTGSRIRITYAESPRDENGRKGNRNDLGGSIIQGLYDVFMADGGTRTFTPLWLRTFRYIQMDVVTGSEPLEIAGAANLFTAYPFEQKAAFECDDPSLGRIWETAWRTVRLCAFETYMDCPYYEQLQYIGDTRIQALISLTNTDDDRLVRSALEQFDRSRVSEGITQSRYPSGAYQFIPPFSLWWVAMIRDYAMYRCDAEFGSRFIPGIRDVLDYFERHTDGSGLVRGLEWFNFMDWSDRWPWGVPPGVDTGHSAAVSLQLACALQAAAPVFRDWGLTEEAEVYESRCRRIQSSVRTLCWDERRGLYADTPEKNSFSQHTNILAVLTGTAPTANQSRILERTLADTSLAQCTMYFKFYLFRALKKAGLADLYLDQLSDWHDAIAAGLTTFPENPIGNTSVVGTRSDCHAWSASPLFDLLTTVAGIEPAEPGFKSVSIEPALGRLKWIRARMPHPLGDIVVELKRRGPEGLSGRVVLPRGLKGRFVWKNRTADLSGGEQRIDF